MTPSLPQGGRHRKTQALPSPRIVRGQTGDPRGFQKEGAKKREPFKKKSDPRSESQCNRGHLSIKKWESEKHKSWCMPAEFKGHVATDGSLLGTAGKWEACGWAVVQLDYDEEFGALHGMYGSMEAEYDVQRHQEGGADGTFMLAQKK